MLKEADHITLHDLGLVARAGVPDMERAIPQRLSADIRLWPRQPLSDLDDDLSRTVDYGAAARLCRATASRGEYRLIETLADSLCSDLLQSFPLKTVRVTLKKSILPDTDAVSVTLTRHGSGSPVAPTPH
ncbi:MAG TPA: dihydroneopterin aldolase [Verrucomicrobiales bacterium]|nr:dihydroneopterin aldolase [Verrucomicrobiales bacterium]